MPDTQRDSFFPLAICLPFFLFYCLLTFLSKDHFFFWDTVQLGSHHAHWYFENNFQYFFLPEEIDSGHPPFFGMGLAFLWKIFGKELWVGHMAMLPFLSGIVYFGGRVSHYFLGKKGMFYFLLLIAVDPFLLGQSVLVSPDLAVVCFWLMAIWGVLSNVRFLTFISCLLLAMISMRGMMMVVVVFLFDVYRQYPFSFSLKRSAILLMPYVPSGIFALIFLGLHMQQTGWIGYHADSPWAASFERVPFSGLIKNFGIYGWRLLDFGRVFLWIIGLLTLVKMWTNKINLSKNLRSTFALLVLAVFILSPTLLLYRGLLGHRYLLPICLLIDLLAIQLILSDVWKVKTQRLLFSICFIGLLTGNLWVYPKEIAQGWDSTLAHWPYYNLRNKMLTFMEQEQIDLSEVGTVFPNTATLQRTDLVESKEQFATLNLDENQYVFYSNVFNDLSDEQLEELFTEWETIQHYAQMQICVILYKKKN